MRARGARYGIPLHVASVEDLVLAKLERAKLGGSTRQLEDVARLLESQPSLDAVDIERWLDELGVRRWAGWREPVRPDGDADGWGDACDPARGSPARRC